MNGDEMRAQGASGGRGQRTVWANRVLLIISLVAIALGVALGHTFITWINATLL
jgi:hypothetical protein